MRFCTSGEEEVTVTAETKTVTVKAAEVHEHKWENPTYRTYTNATNEKRCETVYTCACGEKKVIDVKRVTPYLTLLLDSGLTVNYKFAPDSIKDFSDINLYVVKYAPDGTVLNDKDLTEGVYEKNSEGTERISYAYGGIYASQMMNNISMTAYGTNSEGFKIMLCEIPAYSIGSDLLKRISKIGIGEVSAQLAAERTMYVDLAFYGAATQKFAKYNYTNGDDSTLPTSLIPEYLQFATDPDTITDYNTAFSKTPQDSVWGISLVMGSTLGVGVRFNKSIIAQSDDKASVRVDYGNGKSKTYTYSEFEEGGKNTSGADRWKVTFEEITSIDTRSEFTFNVLDSEGNVVQSFTSSHENFARGKFKSADTNEQYLAKRMAVYGRAASCYFRKEYNK